MTTHKEALTLALEALERIAYFKLQPDTIQNLTDHYNTAIKEAFAQPEQEPTNLERHERNVQKFLGTQQPKEPEQEPVVDFYITREMAKNIKELKTNWTICASGSKFPKEKKTVPVFIGYTTPPQRKPLTDAQSERLYRNIEPSRQQDARSLAAFKRLLRVIEAAHGIKE